ncbi:glycerate kinase [Arthrobacter sp.]|uniref:glycerate kinase n=1 Tax=Arthrobacter sp. TaxID=1667 RepID=UPI003397C3C5
MLPWAVSPRLSPSNLASVRRRQRLPGAGAAGGAGYATFAVLAAERRPGVDVVLELTGLLSRLAGRRSGDHRRGQHRWPEPGRKTPRAAARCSVPVIAVCGRTTLSGIALAATYSLSAREPDLQKSMANAHVLLEQIGEEIGRTYS